MIFDRRYRDILAAGIMKFSLESLAMGNWRPWSAGGNAFLVPTEKISVVRMRDTDSKRMRRKAFSEP
jgi:hypothetical protein